MRVISCWSSVTTGGNWSTSSVPLRHLIRHVPKLSLIFAITGSIDFSLLLSERRCFSRIIDSIAFVFLIEKNNLYFRVSFNVCASMGSQEMAWKLMKVFVLSFCSCLCKVVHGGDNDLMSKY